MRYDKSQHEGRGDRAAESKWQMVKGPVDVVLFEGWMLGFRPLSDADAEKVIPTCQAHAAAPLVVLASLASRANVWCRKMSVNMCFPALYACA